LLLQSLTSRGRWHAYLKDGAKIKQLGGCCKTHRCNHNTGHLICTFAPSPPQGFLPGWCHTCQQHSCKVGHWDKLDVLNCARQPNSLMLFTATKACRYGPAYIRTASGQVVMHNQAPGSVTGVHSTDTWHRSDALHHAYNQHTQPSLNIASEPGQQPVGPVQEEWDPEGPGATSNSSSGGVFITGDHPVEHGGGGSTTIPFAFGLPDRHAATESMFSHWSTWDPAPTAAAGPYSGGGAGGGGGGALVSTTALQHALQVQAQQQQQSKSRRPGFGWGNKAPDKVYTIQPGPKVQPGGKQASGPPFMMLGGEQGPQQDGRYRMAGLGFGLPLTRLHARYFGGDLVLQVRVCGPGLLNSPSAAAGSSHVPQLPRVNRHCVAITIAGAATQVI
jgi:hypothetical protein